MPHFVQNIFYSLIPSSAPSVIWKVYTSPESSRHNRVVHGFCILRCVLNANNMPLTRRTRNTSTLADPGHVPADLDLGRLYVKDLRSLCSRLNLPTTGGRAALIKRIDEARQNTDNLSGTPPLIQDGGEHIANQNATEMQFQQLQRQVQELLDRESPQDGLLSATQLTQVQSTV